MISLTDVEVGYLAGLVDGEGCITLRCQNSSGSVKSQPLITVSNANAEVIDWLCQHCGGNTSSHTHPDNSGHRTSFRWETGTQKNVREILELVSPHLIVKCLQAQYVLSYLDAHQTRHVRKYTEEERQAEAQWAEGMHVLNKRGRIQP